MKTELEQVLPGEIEARSFEIISKELGELDLEERDALVVKRVIHATADFDYAKNLVFSKNAVEHALKSLKRGTCIVTDTQMAMAGINKKALKALGIEVYNFMSDPDVAELAEQGHTTRAVACMDKAAALGKPVILAVGNAPTALIRIYELVQEGKFLPDFIIGVPVGFVNVVPSKELILTLSVPHIVARGRKGGSNTAADRKSVV